MTSPVTVILVSLMLSVSCFAQSVSCEKSFCVGAAKTEITAPPGFPTGGHGPAGSIARGSWSRTWARAFAFKDPLGTVVVLVSCDTFAVPLSLTKYVWDTVNDKPEVAGLKPEGLLIAATHTHQGAGNYMDAFAYNAFGSAKTGFSRPLFDFLVRQVSAAVVAAAKQMRPAELRLYSAKVQDGFEKPFLVNRSPAPFTQNWDADAVMDELGDFAPDQECSEKHIPGEPDDGWNLGRCPRLRAVDRRLVVLQAKEISSGRPFANLVFFAVHPTVLIHTAPLFNSDFTGYAMDALERNTPKLIAGFFNGAEGDITPRRFYRDVLEVVERGKQFLKGVESVLSEPEKDPLDAKITLRARLINTRSSNERNCVAGAISGRLARLPLVGAAQFGGGEIDRTIFFDFGWKPGVRSFTAAEDQGSKKPALSLEGFPGLSLLTRLGALTFPSSLAVTYLKLGNFSLGAVPLEVSTTAGYRIRKYMESSGDVFQLLGLTNGYASYVATASEYAAQDYMGASTLWGPGEADFVFCELATLRLEPQATFRFPDIPLGHTDPFQASIVGQRRDLPDEELEEIIRDDKQIPMRHLPFFEWYEHISRADKYTAASRRRVWVTTAANATVVDDTDFGFIKILRQAPIGDCEVWNAIWLGPLLQDVASVEYIFNVTTAAGDTVISKPFSVDLYASTKPSPVGRLTYQKPCK